MMRNGNEQCRRLLSSPTENSVSSAMSPMLPKSKAMEHPVDAINRATKISFDGDYAMAIDILAKNLQNIKLILSGDAKVIMPSKAQVIDERNCSSCMSHGDCKHENHHSPKTPGNFEYEFSDSSTGSSSFVAASTPLPGSECDLRTVYIFTKPIIVKGDSFDVALDTRVCQELSCVTIYNLALFHQLQAISLFSPKDSSIAMGYLHRALNLYGYSHELFKSQKLPMRIPLLHYMALVCNLGTIHHLVGNQSAAHQCNEYLLSLLMYTIDGRKLYLHSDEPNNSDNIHIDHCIDGFLAIVEHLIVSKKTTAPAA